MDKVQHMISTNKNIFIARYLVGLSRGQICGYGAGKGIQRLIIVIGMRSIPWAAIDHIVQSGQSRDR